MAAPRLLIIDDEPAIIQMLKLLLTDETKDIDDARSAAQARALLAAHTYDAVISDIRLPDGDGRDLLRGGAGTPPGRWVMMTAFADDQLREECLAAGAAAFFSKPFHLGDVRNVVLRVLAA